MSALRIMNETSAPLRNVVASQSNVGAGFDADLVLQSVPMSRRCVRAGQHVYRAGQPFQSVHFLHAGFVKSTIASADGREKVTGFHMRGELLGLESLGMTAHACDAIALDDGEVWEVQYGDLLAACARAPALQHGLAAALATQIRTERSWTLSLGTLNAEQRVAALLLELGARLHSLGFSATHFVLRMTRVEIGSFLGLQFETVTRALTQLDERGLIDVQRRDIRILEVQGLNDLISVHARTH